MIERADKRNRMGRNLIWSVPVGLQLSVIYALLFSLILALLGWALYTQLEGFLVQNTAQRLETFTRPGLLRILPSRGEHGDPHSFPTSDPSSSFEKQVAESLVRELNRSDVAIAVLDAQGKTLASTQSTGNDSAQIPPLPQGWEGLVKSPPANSSQSTAPGPQRAAQWVVANPGSERQLVVLTPITVRSREGGEVSLLLQQVTSLGAADAVLNQVRLYILLGIIAGTILGVVAGLALTRVVLRPLDRMVRTAEAIAGGDLDRRLRLPAGRNEVARLGSSFDNMVERLGSALDAQKRFVADASHELRTPLTSMEGLSEMLLMGADRGDTKVVQKTVRSIHSELGRLGRLVADLLTLSRLDATGPMRVANVDVGRVIAEVAEQMRPLAEAKGARLAVVSTGEALVQGEPDRLKQVVLNLVDNAIRYTPKGGEVRLSAIADPLKGEARIEVRDAGPGIALQDMPHIFDRFYRGDASRARATGNTGLGLAIARAIVEAHSGRIGVESTLGAGSTFYVALPLAQPPDAQRGRQPLVTRKAERQKSGEQAGGEQATPQRVV